MVPTPSEKSYPLRSTGGVVVTFSLRKLTVAFLLVQDVSVLATLFVLGWVKDLTYQ